MNSTQQQTTNKGSSDRFVYLVWLYFLLSSIIYLLVLSLLGLDNLAMDDPSLDLMAYALVVISALEIGLAFILNYRIFKLETIFGVFFARGLFVIVALHAPAIYGLTLGFLGYSEAIIIYALILLPVPFLLFFMNTWHQNKHVKDDIASWGQRQNIPVEKMQKIFPWLKFPLD